MTNNVREIIANVLKSHVSFTVGGLISASLKRTSIRETPSVKLKVKDVGSLTYKVLESLIEMPR